MGVRWIDTETIGIDPSHPGGHRAGRAASAGDGRRVDDHAMQEANHQAVIPAKAGTAIGLLRPLVQKEAAPVSRKTLHPAADERCRITLPPARGTHPHPIRVKRAIRVSPLGRGPKATEKLRETRRNGNVQLCISTASMPARDARL